MTDLLRALAVLGLVAANAFFVVAEYAIVTSRRAALRPRADAGHSGARAALRLMDQPVRVMSTVQVGITASGILIGAVGEPLVRELLGDWVPHGLGFSVAFLVVTYLSVVFGELAPKALTLHNAEVFAALVAPAIELVAQILRPVVWLLEGSARVVLRPFRVRELVAGESIRSPVGIVHVRDLIAAARRRSAATVGELVRTAMVVSESKDLGALLREMREHHEQLAVVVDEHGAVTGIASLEDVLEELVGDIQDEFELPDARLAWVDDGTLRVAGSMTIDDFNEAVGARLPQAGSRTLAGLVP